MQKASMPIKVLTLLCLGISASPAVYSADAKMKSDHMEKDKSAMKADKDSKSMPMVYESWTLYFDVAERNATTLYFESKSSSISSIEKNRLHDWVQMLKETHPGTSAAVVASWSDKPYPGVNDKALASADKDLADKRNDAIEKLLKDEGFKSVETFSMAERPNWFQKTFGTDSAQIKGAAKDKGWDNKNEARLNAILERRGGPGKAVVIFRPADKNSMSNR